jgi:LuxR family maltose regulon positive regulatory protein
MVALIEPTHEAPPAWQAGIRSIGFSRTPTVVRRPRVSERLDRALRAPLIVIAAPAGSGKTTALRAWLPEAPHPHAWLALDEDDDGVEAFLRRLIAAVQALRPAFGGATLAALTGASAPPPPLLATALLGDLAEAAGEFILVLDDYHVIRDPGVHALMRRVVERLPDGVHLVVAARSTPPWPLARLRTLDWVADLGAADLCFTPPEATALLELAAGRTLEPAVVAAALARAEGWALGLRVVGAALRDRPDGLAVVARLGGDSHRDLLQYFVEEVLARQSAPVQASLLTSSILDRFTPALCGAVAGDDPAVAAAEGLDWPGRTDLFLIALDDEPGWYRRHPLCREALRLELRKRHGSEAMARLHRRASAWFADQGMIDQAIRHALAAGEESAAVRLVERRAMPLILAERWLELEGWLDLLPVDAAMGSPWLLACRAWTLWQRQDFGRMPALLERAEALGARLDAALGDAPAASVQPVVDALWAALHLNAGASEQALARAESARAAAGDGDHPLYGWAIFFEGVALQAAGQPERAQAALTRALAESARQGRALSATHALFGLTVVHYLSGRLGDMEAAAERLLELHEAAGRAVGAGWAHYWLGILCYERNERERARHHFGRVIAGRHLVNQSALRDSVLATAMLDHVEGRAEAIEASLAGLDDIALNTQNYEALQQLDDFRALLALARGDLATAERRLTLTVAPPEPGILAFLPPPQLIRIRALLARGDAEAAARALAAATDLQAAAEARGHRRRLIEVLAVRALAHERLGQATQAREHLERALALAEPGGFIRTFVDLGPELARLLGALARQGVAADYVGRLLGEFAASPAHRPAAAEAAARREHAQAQLIEPLTDRELAVVRLLGQRLSYAEIAVELTISPSTVKTHVNHIYGKLGASGRKDAIIHADRLGLLNAACS